MKIKYIVTFNRNEIWCVNIAIAEDSEIIIEHYESKGYKVLNIKKAKDYEIEEYTKRKMPVIYL